MKKLYSALLSLALVLSILPAAFGAEAEQTDVPKAQILRRGGVFAVADLQGNLLTDYRYWNAHEFAYGYAAVQNDRQEWGYVDETGTEVIPCRYYSGDVDDFGPDGLAVAGRPGAYQLVDTTGRELLAQTSDKKPWRAGFDLIGYTQGEKLGYINTQGEVVVPPQYVYYTDPKGFLRGGVFGENGVAWVYPEWGAEPVGIDVTGQVVAGELPKPVPLPEGLSITWGNVDEISPGDEDVGQPENPPELEVFRVPGGPLNRLEEGMCGYADPRTGEEVLPAIYDQAGPFSQGIGLVRIGEDHFAIDREGNRLFDWNEYILTGDRFSEGLLPALERGSGQWGALDRTGALVIPAQWDSMLGFQEGLAVVVKDGKYGYLDQTGALVVPCVLESADPMKHGLAVITYQGKTGVLKSPLEEKSTSDWAAKELASAREAGYITPRCETYQTYEITRLQFAELAVNYLEKATGKPLEPAKETTFTDTTDKEVLKAYAAGIVQGVGEGLFAPEDCLTRQELAVMLWRTMVQAGVAFESSSADLTQYADGVQVATWAEEALAALVGAGILQGTGEDSLSPQGSCTVEQAILLVYRGAK